MDQKKPVVNLLDKISPSDLEKIRAHQADTSGALPVDNEWMLLAEFARVYGWQAYQAVKNDEIKMPEMMTLIEANRKLELIAHYRDAEASFIAAASAKAGKKTVSTFKKLTEGIIRQTKVQE